jgi:hypothetical protein
MNIQNLTQEDKKWLKGSSYAIFDGEASSCLSAKQHLGFSIIQWAIFIAIYGSLYFVVTNVVALGPEASNIKMVGFFLVGSMISVVIAWHYFLIKLTRMILWKSGKWENIKLLQEKEVEWNIKGIMPFWTRIAALSLGIGYYLFKMFSI